MMVNLPCLMESCSNFLRPTCSYTECRLSFQTGSCPTERTTSSYSSCLYLILLTGLFCKALKFSVDATPYFPLLVLLRMECCHTASWLSGYCSRTLLDFRFFWNPAGVWNYGSACMFTLCCLYNLLRRVLNVCQKFLRIILYTLRQDCVNYP